MATEHVLVPKEKYDSIMEYMARQEQEAQDRKKQEESIAKSKQNSTRDDDHEKQPDTRLVDSQDNIFDPSNISDTDNFQMDNSDIDQNDSYDDSDIDSRSDDNYPDTNPSDRKKKNNKNIYKVSPTTDLFNGEVKVKRQVFGLSRNNVKIDSSEKNYNPIGRKTARRSKDDIIPKPPGILKTDADKLYNRQKKNEQRQYIKKWIKW